MGGTQMLDGYAGVLFLVLTGKRRLREQPKIILVIGMLIWSLGETPVIISAYTVGFGIGLVSDWTR